MRYSALAAVFLLTQSTVYGQAQIGTGPVAEVYRQHCASCHGDKLEGGLGGSLLQSPWQHGSDAEAMTRIITAGLPDHGMPSFGDSLSPEDTRALVIYILEERSLQTDQPTRSDSATWSDETIFNAGETSFRAITVADSDSELWAIDFLPDGRLLATERDGNLRILENGQLGPPIANTPEVLAEGQGGLLDVGVHPDYAENGWIYLSYSEKRGDPVQSMTAVVRGRIRDGRWVDQEEIFHARPDDFLETRHHYGSRFAFHDGYVFFGVGDRGKQDVAQDVTKPNGKIHRLHDDGRIPADNPFVDTPDAYPSIWSFGHRNPQGLTVRPGTGEIWESEHGPRGGDELNLIAAGANFGWPKVTYGMNYDGTPITSQTSAPGITDPVTYWLPSLGVCGIAFYDGDAFPQWKGNLLVTGLATQDLRRVVLDGSKFTSQEILFKGLGRMRDVISGPDGHPYAIVNNVSGDRAKPGRIIKLIPDKAGQ